MTRKTAARLRGALEQMIPNYDHLFQEVRGMGLMLGLKLKSDSRRFVAHLRDEAMVGDWKGVLRGSIKAWNRLATSSSLIGPGWW